MASPTESYFPSIILKSKWVNAINVFSCSCCLTGILFMCFLRELVSWLSFLTMVLRTISWHIRHQLGCWRKKTWRNCALIFKASICRWHISIPFTFQWPELATKLCLNWKETENTTLASYVWKKHRGLRIKNHFSNKSLLFPWWEGCFKDIGWLTYIFICLFGLVLV